MIQSVSRLEQALRLWEDHCLFYQNFSRLAMTCPYELSMSTSRERQFNKDYLAVLRAGPVLSSGKFRKFLLDSLSTATEFEYDTFIGPDNVIQELGSKAFLPIGLWAWTRSSRRVYQLTRELQLLLSVTSLNGLNWGDIYFPFDAYCIAVDDPIIDEESGIEYDLILVSRIGKDTVENSWTDIEFTLFPKSLESYQCSSRRERDSFRRALNKKDWRGAVRRISAFSQRFGDHVLIGQKFSLGKNHDAPIIDDRWVHGDNPDHVGEGMPVAEGDMLSLFQKAARLVAGLCLYFRSLPPEHTYVQEERQTAKDRRSRLHAEDDSLLVDIAKVCTVSSSYELTSEERSALGEACGRAGGYEIRAHFRCGYWRRPPGQGSNLEAKKNVWVRPTLVRRDRIRPGTLPGGSEQII